MRLMLTCVAPCLTATLGRIFAARSYVAAMIRPLRWSESLLSLRSMTQTLRSAAMDAKVTKKILLGLA